MTKICTKCKEIKDINCFNLIKGKKPNSWCKRCVNRAKTIWIQKKTLENRSSILGKPERCEICGERFEQKEKGRGSGKNSPQFDHNHTTLEARGWLCFSCNTALGRFGDNPLLLNRAEGYLRKHGYSISKTILR